jgi:hypothetical protein
MLANAKIRARRAGVPFNIIEADLEIPSHCPALGIPLFIGDGVAGPNSPTLDRIRPELGYTRGNVIIISGLANAIKSSASSEQIYAVAHWLQSLGA